MGDIAQSPLLIEIATMTIAAQWPKPNQILEYYRRSLEALGALKKAVSLRVTGPSRFTEMSASETESALREMARELDHEVTLLLTASFEASFQVDFRRRVAEKKKDSVSRKLRKFWRKRKKESRFRIEEILEIWQNETGQARAIGNLKQLIQFRHWLAHGRYWVQKSGLIDPDPFDAWAIGKAVFELLPDYTPLSITE